MKSAESPAREAVELYGSLVIRVAWHILRDREEARDIYQEAFLRLHSVWLEGQQIDNVKAWLCRTAINAALNRRRRLIRETSLDTGGAELQESRRAGAARNEKALLLDRVRQLVERLPDRQRQVFVLRNFEGLPFSEIAQMLDCTAESARANEYQALRKIRNWMNNV
ncbi:MAG TPA: sigma-70 family RNA polymerase sigma factor [Blastocatellia bacterium]|nr:sigma-70 family RNA polymerase sigma factor [Blastocatellia bacterium]